MNKKCFLRTLWAGYVNVHAGWEDCSGNTLSAADRKEAHKFVRVFLSSPGDSVFPIQSPQLA